MFLGALSIMDYEGAFSDKADNIRLDEGSVMRIDGGTCEVVKNK